MNVQKLPLLKEIRQNHGKLIDDLHEQNVLKELESVESYKYLGVLLRKIKTKMLLQGKNNTKHKTEC